MSARPLSLLALLACVVLSSSSHAGRVLRHDAYIWQRHWSPALLAAIDRSADMIQSWRVLAAQADRAGRLHDVAVDWKRLGPGTVAVIRIDGRTVPDAEVMAARIGDALDRWRASGASIVGLEIDHDCATAQLGQYARLLGLLRVRLDPALRLSITALPTWTASPALPTLLQAVSDAVLQVHAVQSPRAGLFNPGQARDWIDAFARRSPVPFRVALPTYGTRVSWDDDGTLLGVESERAVLRSDSPASELIAAPDDVAALLRDLAAHPPAHFTGVVWFRLPTDNDQRAWSLGTWRAVMQGEPVATMPVLTAETIAGVQRLVLRNHTQWDAALPASIRLPPGCELADGANSYRLDGTLLHRTQPGLLRSGGRQVIGWMRCDARVETANVTP